MMKLFEDPHLRSEPIALLAGVLSRIAPFSNPGQFEALLKAATLDDDPLKESVAIFAQIYRAVTGNSLAQLPTTEAAFAELVGSFFVAQTNKTFDGTLFLLPQNINTAHIAHRYALVQLNSFAIEGLDYSSFNSNGELDIFDPIAKTGALTLDWVKDRTALLATLVASRTANNDSIGYSNLLQNDRSYEFRYIDPVTGAERILLGENTTRQGGVTRPVPSQLISFGSDQANFLTGSDNLLGDHLYGGDGNDTLRGKAGNDYLEGDAGDDTLDGGSDGDTLVGGTGADVYLFSSAFGKDTIVDADGLGQIKIDGMTIDTAKASGRRNVWIAELTSGKVELAVYDDARSSTGKKLVITRPGSVDNSVTITNFDLAKAQNGGYLGIQLDSTIKLVLQEGGGNNPFADPSFNPSTVSGSSLIDEGSGSPYVLFLNIPAKEGDTITLSFSALGDKFKVVLGDRTVDADGAVITLAEGQNKVTFSLVQEGDVTADANALLSASYQGSNQAADSNPWGINLKDTGEIGHTFIGDQRGQTITNAQTGDQHYDWASTSWTPEGVLTGGIAEAGYKDVIKGGAGNDKIDGKSGNDLLYGDDGNDEIDGGDGDDVIGGGKGSDDIKGGAGNDVILSATDVTGSQRNGPTDNWDPTLAANGGSTEMDDASDAIDAGDGNDIVYAGRGDDRIEGGAGNDVLWGLAGDDIIEGGAGDDFLHGDGVGSPGGYNNTPATSHGSDFLDGGDGNDTIVGYGKDDSLFGGAGNDILIGDAGESELAGEYHGDDYLDGEDGDDTLFGYGKADTLYGGDGNDTLFGDAGEASLAGEYHGDDYLDGEDGDDELFGNGGSDTLYGGDGDDRLQGDNSGFPLSAEYHGDDYLDGEGGADYLWGDGGNDTLYGGEGDDQLSGDSSDLAGEYHGDDYLDGEEGDDILWGGGGDDILIGGTGNDEIYADTGVAISNAHYLAGEYHGDDYIDAGDGDDYAEGNGGNDHLEGGDGADTLWGDAAVSKLEGEFHGKDYLDGGAGDDALAGGGEDDTLYGGTGNDLLWGDNSGVNSESNLAGEFHGNDYLDGEEGDDELQGDGGNDTLIGGAGKDKLFGDDEEIRLEGQFHGEDYLDGGDGDDYAEGGGNDDTILGGAGDDVLWGDALESKISLEFHGDDTIDGGEGADKIYGGGGDDVLQGGDGNDILHGDSGDDQLEGGAGDDILMGGDGDDTLIDSEGHNTFDGGAGNDTIAAGDTDNDLEGGDGDDTITAGDGHNVVGGGAGNDHISVGHGYSILSGGDGNDTLTAGNGNNTLNGDDGNDTIVAGDGQNVLDGGLGDDSITVGNGNNTLSGYEGNDTIVAGNGNNILNGGAGNDSITAGDGGNTLNGDEGSDTITAGSGNDTLNGGEGNDVLSAGDGDNTLMGGNGNDSLTSGAGVDNLSGGNGNDTLHAGAGNDVLNGGVGNDMVYGDAGNDVLYASRGNDTLAGGDGLDTYVLDYSADRSNVIDDSAEGSIIKLGSAGMKFEDLSAVRRANDLVVEVRGTSASMRIKDYYASTQTSWVFEDADGNTTTGEALVQASQTDWAQLQANLLKDFQSSTMGLISRGYSDSGYTQRADGSWYLAANYFMGIARTYDVRTEFSRDVHTPFNDLGHPFVTTSSYVSYADWATQQSGQDSARDWTTTITFQSNNIASGTGTIQSYNYTTTTQSAWSAVQWTGDGGTHSESQWVYESSTVWPTQNPTEFIDYYTRYNLDSVYYEGTVGPLTFQDPGAAAQAGNLPDYVAVDFVHQQTGYNLGPSLLADGDQTVWADQYSAVIGGVGNNTIYGAGFAYGGTGNAQLIGGGTLMAGTGDQLLQFGATMVVGDGHDTVVGYDRSLILVNPDNLGIDLIGQDFDGESDIDDLGQSREIKAIYEAMGFADWKDNYRHGGKFHLVIGEGFGHYFDSLEDARAAFVPTEYLPTFEIALADPYTTWQYVEPLPTLYKTPYFSVEDPANGLVPSNYYAAHGITTTLLTATDFAALQPLLDADLLPKGIVRFGPGLSLADLTLSWGEAAAPLDGATHVTLDILWGPDQGIRIMMPRSGDALNSVAQQFEFSDGTISSLQDLIALAPPAPDLDTGYSRICAGMGEQTADVADVAGIRAVVGSAADLKVESDGVDLLISIIGSSGDSLRIVGWYADSSDMSQAVLFTSGGAVLSAAEMTGKGLIKDGSAGDMDLYGVPDFATTFIAGPNTRMTGDSGMDIYVYNAGSGEVHITDPGGGTVRFGSGVSATATLGLGDGAMVIKLGNQGDMIYLENFDPTDAENFESVFDFEFADGSVLSLQDFLDLGFDLAGTADADTMTGTSVVDRMLAGAGDDVLQGGAGDDTLSGGAGNDVYLFSRGDGVDTINEDDSTVGNVDTIRFDDSVAVADVRVSREGLNLYLSTDGTTDRIEITNWFEDGAHQVERVLFADGTVWDQQALEAAATATVITPTVLGTSADDMLGGTSGADVFDGQAGNDEFHGQGGNDVYLYSRGDGSDIILDYDETVGNIDTVRFDATVLASDVSLSRGFYDLYLNIGGTGERITLGGWFSGDARQIERVQFADGTFWDQAVLGAATAYVGTEGMDILTGSAGSNSFDGAGGDDYFFDMAGGNDVYLYGRGDGSDEIYDFDPTVGNIDTVRFDASVAVGDVTVTRDLHNLYLNIAGDSGRIKLRNWFDGDEYKIEQVEFADGTVWDRQTLASTATAITMTVVGTAGDDYLSGGFGNDTLQGLQGADALYGAEGNDVYLYSRGDGNDTIVDFDETVGNVDTVRFDATVLASDVSLSRDMQNLYLNINGTGDRITLGSWFSGESRMVERVEFADGTVWDQTVLAATHDYVGTEGDDVLISFTQTNILRGYGGNDSLYGANGFDALEGGAGNDLLYDTQGGNYYNAGSGNDELLGNIGADFLIGGTGDDLLKTGAGADLIAFNMGDGQDTVETDGSDGPQDTVSLGGAGLDYANLSLQKNGDDLILKVSDTDQLTFSNWYAAYYRQGVLNLQVVSEAMAAFDATSSDPLLNKKVQTFDFQGLVGAFDAARTATPGLSSWALSNGLTQFHLAGSDSEALGGDLAYHYGADGTLAGMGLGKAQEVLTNAQFGAQAQAIHSTVSLQVGLVRLG